MPLFILGSGERLWVKDIRGLQHMDGVKPWGYISTQEEGQRGDEKGRALKRGGERTEENWALGHSSLRACGKGERESRKENGKGTAGEVGGRLENSGVWKELRNSFMK